MHPGAKHHHLGILFLALSADCRIRHMLADFMPVVDYDDDDDDDDDASRKTRHHTVLAACPCTLLTGHIRRRRKLIA